MLRVSGRGAQGQISQSRARIAEFPAVTGGFPERAEAGSTYSVTRSMWLSAACRGSQMLDLVKEPEDLGPEFIGGVGLADEAVAAKELVQL